MGGAESSRANEVETVTNTELGTKRICPETGKKFYDLGKDPIVSPYTGKEYPRSFFEEPAPSKPEKEKAPASAEKKEPAPEPEAEDETEATEEGAPEFISLEEADEDADDDTDDDEEAIADIPDVEIEVEDDDSDDDTFLEEDEEDDDLSDVISGGSEGDEEV